MNAILSDNRIETLRRYIREQLLELYSERELEQIERAMFDQFLNWSKADLIMHSKERLSESQLLLFHFATKRMRLGEPLQYALGAAWFRGLKFLVSKSVLIPRPETEELVSLVLNELKQGQRVLDIGTGSGCIPISIKKEFPSAEVFALDVSKEALEQAQQNGLQLEVDIHWLHCDVLKTVPSIEPVDIIVSNPPYVLESDKSTMQTQVIDHEPHLALFVPDQDALKFYKRIAQLAKTLLLPHGRVFCEMYEALESPMNEMLLHEGKNHIQFHKDLQQKTRFVSFEN